MHALITRPLEDAKPLAELLAARGVDCVVEPLLEIVPRGDAEVDLDGVQALLFTSANGVRALAAKTSRRDLKVLTVGDGSAVTAREAGFTDVVAARGDVEALAALAIDRMDPKAGPLFHGAGSMLAGDLQGKLEQAGFTLRRAVLYEARTATAFSPETRMNLALGGIDMVLLFSPRTARTFAELWRGADRPTLAKTAALCLSPAVAREISELDWQRIATAGNPDQASMLALLEEEIARRKAAIAETNTETVATPPKSEPGEATRAAPQPRAETEPRRATPAREPLPSRRASGGIVTGLLAGAVAAVAVTMSAPYWQPLIEPGRMSVPAAAGSGPDLAPVEARLDALEAAGAKAITPDALKASVGDAAGKLGQEVTQLTDRIGKLEQALAAQSSNGSPAPALDLQALQFRLAKLETDLTQVSQQVSTQAASVAATGPDLANQIAALKSANDALAQQLNAARDQIKSLASQQTALQSQQTTLGGTVDKIAALPPAVTATEQRRTALVLALGTLRGALSIDKPYAPALKAIDELAADDADAKAKLAPGLDPLRPLSASGAPTLAQLQASLPATKIAEAADAEATAQAVGADAGWSERLINRLSEAVTVRPVGADALGDGPLPRLARGEAKLKSGDLAGAVAELDGLSAKPAAVAADWLAQAKARLAQDQANAALDQVSAALLAPAAAGTTGQ